MTRIVLLTLSLFAVAACQPGEGGSGYSYTAASAGNDQGYGY